MNEEEYRNLLNEDLPEKEYVIDFGGRTTVVDKDAYIEHLVMINNLLPQGSAIQN